MNQDQQLREAAHTLEVAANTVALCYTKRPSNFASALREMEEAARTVRAVLTVTQQAAPSQVEGERQEPDGETAYHIGRAAYEASVNHFVDRPDANPFYELSDYEKAKWIARAALLEASAQREQPAASKPVKME